MFKLAKWAIVVAETININDVESISSKRDWQSRISCAAKMVILIFLVRKKYISS